jgi:ADP-heptose:LPS heptosyltransferase
MTAGIVSIMAKTLIVRYSQIGDVLILIPLVFSLGKQYPDDEFTVLTNPKFAGLFKQMPPNVSLYPMTYRKKRIPLRGLVHLFNRYLLLLKISLSNKYDKVALLQNGTFEDQLQRLFSIRKSKIAGIDLTDFLSKEKFKIASPDSPSLFDLFIRTLSQLDYTGLKNEFDFSFYTQSDRRNNLLEKCNIKKNKQLIGLAPFSRLKAKMYSLDKMEEIIRFYHQKENIGVLILGGGRDEKFQAESWEEKYPGIVSLVDALSFDEEITLISACSLVLSMDSANMHLASFVGVPVVSIWGPSHPKLGYYPVNQDINNAVQKELPCRPCSFWGENPCANANKYECMNIAPEIIIEKINTFIKQ